MGSKYTVIRDTQEKKGWVFPQSEYCKGVVDLKLPTGDYTLVGLEKILCIERKGAIAEFAQNITSVRFHKELERMRLFKYAYLLLEFTMEDLLKFPVGAAIPAYIKRKIKVRGPFILLKYIEYTHEYPNMHIILCGNKGQEVARSIFKRVLENESD